MGVYRDFVYLKELALPYSAHGTLANQSLGRFFDSTTSLLSYLHQSPRVRRPEETRAKSSSWPF